MTLDGEFGGRSFLLASAAIGLSAGMTARYHAPNNGIRTIGARKRAAMPMIWARSSRLSPGSAFTRTQAASPAIARQVTVRNSSEGQKLALKKPVQTL